MADLLVRLYDLPVFEAEEKVRGAGVVIRRGRAFERHVILEWIATHFSDAWVSEAALALSQQPATIYIALSEDRLLGFACYDTSGRGFFGPTGVDEAERGKGIGEALLITTLKGMREAGYAYGVIGDPGPVAFYQKRLDAMEIPKSEPGIYAGMLRSKPNASD
jgi:GNAT superfamily N-acetyltransferase